MKATINKKFRHWAELFLIYMEGQIKTGINILFKNQTVILKNTFNIILQIEKKLVFRSFERNIN